MPWSDRIGRRVVSLAAILLLAGPVTAAPNDAKLGRRIDNVTWHDAAGKKLALADLRDGPAVVIVFLSFDCPVSTSYVAPLNDLAKEYSAQGVKLVGVCPCDATAAEVAQQAKEYKVAFPMFRDEKLAGADAFAAGVTPEAFVLDRNGVMRYRGRIDDAYAARLKKNQQVSTHELRDAVDDVLAGRSVRVASTDPVGCAIPRPKQRAKGGAVTYHRDVEPILQAHCQNCHRPGQVGPFSLMTYAQAVNWADDLKEYTRARKMPPWKPTDGPAFTHDRRLPDKDVTTLAAWVDAGTPEGDPKDAPPPAKFTSDWFLGPPDLVLTVPEEMHVAASGPDLFRCFVLPTGLTEDKYVVAFQVRPGNPRVVHHTLNFIETAGQARKMEQLERDRPKKDDDLDHGPGYPVRMGLGTLPNGLPVVPRGAVGGWAPGLLPRYLPEGVGYYLPKNSDIVLQVHYHRTGRPETDRSQVGLYFAKKPIRERMQGLAVGLPTLVERFTFRIPADDEHYHVHRRLWTDDDCTIYSVTPHMHLLGKEIKVTMTPPNGPPRTLIAIRDWDYNWQESYFFKEPIQAPKGTRFDLDVVYDNSEGNPNNPNHPPKAVRQGEQTTDEMCFGFLGATRTDGKPGPIHFFLDEGKKVRLPPDRLVPRGEAAGK
jgi:peroxiredoxin